MEITFPGVRQAQDQITKEELASWFMFKIRKEGGKETCLIAASGEDEH